MELVTGRHPDKAADAEAVVYAAPVKEGDWSSKTANLRPRHGTMLHIRMAVELGTEGMDSIRCLGSREPCAHMDVVATVLGIGVPFVTDQTGLVKLKRFVTLDELNRRRRARVVHGARGLECKCRAIARALLECGGRKVEGEERGEVRSAEALRVVCLRLPYTVIHGRAYHTRVGIVNPHDADARPNFSVHVRDSAAGKGGERGKDEGVGRHNGRTAYRKSLPVGWSLLDELAGNFNAVAAWRLPVEFAVGILCVVFNVLGVGDEDEAGFFDFEGTCLGINGEDGGIGVVDLCGGGTAAG